MLAVYLFLPVVVIASFAISMAIRQANEEARRFGDELRALGQLRPALVEIANEAERARAALEQLHRR